MPFAARKGDPTLHGGRIAEGSPDVTIGQMPAARLFDKHVCPLPGHVAGPITETSRTVFVNKLGLARVGDRCTCAAPVAGGPGGGGGKPQAVRFDLGGRYRPGEQWLQSRKVGEEPWRKVQPAEFNPKITAELARDFWKGGNAKDKEKLAWAQNVTERGGKARVAYEGEIRDLRNAKVEAGVAYEAAYTGARGRRKWGDTKDSVGEGGTVRRGSAVEGVAEVRCLTVRGGASAGGKMIVRGGKLQAAYGQVEAGAGGSVVEGRLAGKTRGFTIPFVNRRISFAGEVSAALLTAEARIGAFAGLHDGAWSAGIAAQIGAALLGFGGKLTVTVEKIAPPEPPPSAPGVPGFAGIDPIAMGCTTVMIGDSPKPYVPGVPPPLPKRPRTIGGPGVPNRKEAAADPAGEDPVERRRRENRELEMTRLAEDMKKAGVTPERLAWMREKRCPLSFQSPEQYEQFKRELSAALEQSGLGDAGVRLRGTSTTFYSENPSKPLGHHFDKNPQDPADVDMEVASSAMVKRMNEAGVLPHPDYPAIFPRKDVAAQFPALERFSRKWSGILGRKVAAVALVDPKTASTAASDFVLRGAP